MGMKKIGPLHKIVVFKQNTPGDLGAGAADSYATLLTTRGALRKQSGNRVLSFGEIAENNRYELFVRVQSALETVLKVNMRIEIGTRVFIVDSFEKVEEKRWYYKITMNEKLNG